MELLIEIVAVVFSLVCVLYTVKRHILAWPYGIVAATAFMWVFFNSGLYSHATLQVVFLIQSIVGWVVWSRTKDENGQVSVRKMTTRQTGFALMHCGGLIVIGSIILSYIPSANMPFWDCVTAAMSLCGMSLTIKKYSAGWLLWMTTDVILVGLFASQGLYASAVLYFVLFFVALNGYNKWKRNIKLA